MLANIAFREDVDRALAHTLTRTAEQLSYRQLCLLALFASPAVDGLRDSR